MEGCRQGRTELAKQPAEECCGLCQASHGHPGHGVDESAAAACRCGACGSDAGADVVAEGEEPASLRWT